MDYQGYFEIEAKAGYANSFVLGTKYRWASEGQSFQCDLSYPLHRFFNDALDLYLYAEYTNMLAESLLYYTERTHVVRVGLAIVGWPTKLLRSSRYRKIQALLMKPSKIFRNLCKTSSPLKRSC